MADDVPSDQGVLQAGELQRRAITGSVWTAVISCISLPVAFVANAIVVRCLGVTSFGHLTFLSVSIGLAFLFANLGFNNAVIQTGSKAEAAGHRIEVDDLLRRSLGFNAVVEIPIVVVVALVLTRGDPLWEIVSLGIAVILSCSLTGASLSVTIENRTAAAARLSLIATLLTAAGSIVAALLTRSASAVWAVRMLVPALLVGLNLLLLDPTRRRAVLQFRMPSGLGRAFWRFSLLSWVSGLLALLVFSRSEIFILELFHQKDALGLFALAFGLSQIITAPADAMLHPLLPAVAGLLSSWPERAAQAFDRSTRVSSLVCGGVAATAVPVLVLAIPLIYGHAFDRAAWLFIPLALVSVFQSVNNPVVAFVNGRQQGGLIVKTTAFALVADVVVAVALIPTFGAWGAVVANVIGQLVSLVWLAAKEPQIVTGGFRRTVGLYRAFVLGSLIGAGALGAGALLESSSALGAPIIGGIAGGVLYVVSVHLSRSGLKIDDRDALIRAMPSAAQRHLSWLLRPVTVAGEV